jgi:hypothetical protein
MEKTITSFDDKLLDYLDGKLSVLEIQTLEQQLQTNAALQYRLEELRSLNNSLRQFSLEQPSKNFTHRVMEKLDQYPAQTGFSIRNGIFLLIGVLIAVGIAALLVTTGAFNGANTAINLNKYELPQKYIQEPLPSIPFNGKLLVNIIIFLNVAIALIVLDRTVLKPFFQKRMETGH